MDISLDNFQGPMDLLLYLVKKKEMDIRSIKIEIIIDEYLNFINHLEKMNLNIASSYLVMSSELLELKSRMLLPGAEVSEEVIDLKENLINKIIEYEKYQKIVPELRELELERLNYKTKSPTNILEYKPYEKLESNLTIDTLVEAYKNFLERIEDEKPITTKVTKKEISIESRILRIKERLKKEKTINFNDLFDVKSKPYIVATFLAVLEMVRFKELKIYQEENFKTIICEAVK